MIFHKLLEASRKTSFFFPPGEGPDNIKDFRDPNAKTKKHWVKYDEPYTGRDGVTRKGFWSDPPRLELVLTKDHKGIIYYYGNHNIIEWGDLLNYVNKHIDESIKLSSSGIVFYKGGWLISQYNDIGSWSGNRTKYSSDLKVIVDRIKELGLADDSTPIWLGNTSGLRGKYVGSVGKILSAPDVPDRIVVYHGTSSIRLKQIEKYGLQPLPLDQRVWNKGGPDKNRPEHRDDSVYLTVSLDQAEYYANKATRIDRKRMGPAARRDAYYKNKQLETRIDWFELALEKPDILKPSHPPTSPYYRRHDDKSWMTPKYIKDQLVKLKNEKKKLEIMLDYGYDPIEPVILKIVLTQKDMEKLMADDDWLAMTNMKGSPGDWQSSMSEFGQIALRGKIPPRRIKVFAKGKDVKY